MLLALQEGVRGLLVPERLTAFEGEPEDIIKAAFSQGGLLASKVGDFEERPQQLEMALAVWDSLVAKSHLMVEAGTGIGKSLAYLFPSALWCRQTGERIVISTQTVNLQEQLVNKDIPMVADLLSESGFDLRYSYMKGRGHYVCLRRLKQACEDVAQTTSLFVANAEEKAVQDIYELAAGGSWDGDRERLPSPVPDSVWSMICSEGDRCMSSKCSNREFCFYQKRRRRLEECHIIVVNHALFAAHLAIWNQSGGHTGLLPGYEAVIFDEAHHLEDAIRDSMGTEVSPGRLKRLVDDTVRMARSGAVGKSITREGIRRLRDALDNRVAAINSILEDLNPVRSARKDKARLRDGGSFDPDIIKSIREFGKEIQYWEDFDLSDEERFEVSSLKRRFTALSQDLTSISNLEGDGESHVYWAESIEGMRRGHVVLKKAPLEVGSYLQETLWSSLPAAVLTSATLATGSSFEYQRRMLALEGAGELILGSPFNYREQARLCIPKDSRGLDVNSLPFGDYIAEKVLEIAGMTDGRMFVLFTNRRSMERVAELVRDRVEEKGYPFLKQGDGPRDALLRDFKDKGNAVLFGLDSFWEGVDVPGDALSCVVITKLPFPVPDDPIMEAREQVWRSQGLVPFIHYSLPVATLKLKQGFGRLIRSKTDRGAVVILDPRIATKRYGRVILQSLPPARLTFDLDDVAEAVTRGRR
jgi:ATP-dependent DNA helicase DinG